MQASRPIQPTCLVKSVYLFLMQVARPAQSSHSQKSGSSSEPSEEMLDDPTNMALSQRAHAHLPTHPITMPHGDPVLQAGLSSGAADKEEDEGTLPTRRLPKSGEWTTKRGVLLCLVVLYFSSSELGSATLHQSTLQSPINQLSLACQPSKDANFLERLDLIDQTLLSTASACMAYT